MRLLICKSFIEPAVFAVLQKVIRNGKRSILILYSGEDAGYLETCGCSPGQLGGIARRHTIIKYRRDMSPVLLLHNGDLINEPGLQQEIKYQVITNALIEMKYDAVNVGEGDLLLGIDQLLQSEISEMLISANLFRNGETVFKPYVVRSYALSGLKLNIGIVGVISQEFAPQIKESAPDLMIEAPSEALARVLEENKAQDVQLIILLAHCEVEEAKSLAKQFPSLDLVISGHGMEDGLDQPVVIGDTMILNPGTKGKRIGELELILDHSGKIVEKRHKLIPVRDTIERSTDILPLLHLYRMMLKDYDLLHEVEKRLVSENSFVGSETCQQCHSEQYKLWKNTGHAHAYKTLLDRDRHYDPECLRCHTVGYDYQSGFISAEETPLLKDVGCESCHGPASGHIQDKNAAYKVKFDCRSCHTEEHSPKFDYQKYWDKIAH